MIIVVNNQQIDDLLNAVRMMQLLLCLFFSVFQDFCLSESTSPFSFPIYWINMDSNTERKLSMESHLNAINVVYHKRIEAKSPETCNLIMVETPCMRVKLKDIAVVCSHIHAIHTALHDPNPVAKRSSYFLVLEDDIRFQWKVDFSSLISMIPKGFGSVQLMMSHKPQIQEIFSIYNESVGKGHPQYVVPRPRNASIWSAQAILYSKEIIRPIINKIVSFDRHKELGYKLVNSFKYDQRSINPYHPSIPCECLFSDMYLYAMAQPSYVLTVPLFNSGDAGLNSTMHQTHVVFHIRGFAEIEQVVESMKEKRLSLPSFLQPFSFSIPSESSELSANKQQQLPGDYWRRQMNASVLPSWSLVREG
jgi:hypothetical protein